MAYEHQAHGSDGSLATQLGRAGLIVAGGALAYQGWHRRGPVGYGLLALGGLMIGGAVARPAAQTFGGGPRALEWQTPALRWTRPISITQSITIGKPRAEVYRFWRQFENLARFMAHVESVEQISERRSHWVLRGPVGRGLEWDAEIEDERADERIAWRSDEDADIRHEGTVMFRDAPGGRGTEVHLSMRYEAPGGQAGHTLARLLGEGPDRKAREDLRRLKQLLETGEVVTAETQSGAGH